MTGQESFAASAGVSSAAAAIVIVIIVCGSAFGILELQLLSTDSGGPGVPSSTVTATVTTTLISISTTTIMSSTHLTQGLAQVTVTAASFRSSDFLATNAGITFTCGSAAGSFLSLSNVGTAGTSVDMVTITWAGQTDSYSQSAGSSCSVGAAGSASATQNLLFATTTKLHIDATAGGTFSGTVTLAGAVILFTGTFQ